MKKIFLSFLLILFFQIISFANTDFITGYKYFTENNYSDAIKSFELAKANPEFLLPDYNKFFIAKSHYWLKNFSSAEALAKELIDAKHKVLLPEAYILIGRCRLDSGNYQKAADAFAHLIKKYPDNRLEALAYYMLAESYQKLKKYKSAFKLYHYIDVYLPFSAYAKKSRIKMRELRKKYGYKTPKVSDKDLYRKGEKYWRAYSYKKAVAMFSQLAKKYPRSKYVKSALYMTGLAEYETKDYTAAISTLERNIRQRGPHWQNSYYYLGRAYGRRGKYQKGINTLQYFIHLYPKSPLADNAYYYIGYYHEIEDNFKSAVIAYDNILKKYPKSAITDVALWRAGRIYYRFADYKSARYYFAQAINAPIGLDTPKCIYWWGKLLEEANVNDAAAVYAYLIKKFDHTYYAYRANARLDALGFVSPMNELAIKEQAEIAAETLPARAQILLQAGLDEYAKEEAGITENDSYQTSLGLLLHRYGEYRAPIYIAEKKVKGAILKNEADKLDKKVWQLAFPKGFWTYVKKESQVFGVDPYLVLALIREESKFNPKAISRSYARGLMQIISPTARKISKALGMRYYYKNLYKPEVNIKMGTYYLSSLIKRFRGNVVLALAGYNGGPVRVNKWVWQWYNGNYKDLDIDDFIINIPIRETRNYVEKVLGSYYQYKRIYD